MRKPHGLLLLYFAFHLSFLNAQTIDSLQPSPTIHSAIARLQLFTSDDPVTMTIITDFRKMHNEKVKGTYQGAKITMHIPNSDTITEDIRLYARGEYRRKYCSTPGIMLNFKNPTSPRLSGLKKIKMVCACTASPADEKLLLEEYLIYKLYNLITPYSFKVRLAQVTFQDSNKKGKDYTQYAFLIEDLDDLAARNQCVAIKNRQFYTSQTDRTQMTIVALFEYMISNTDWTVPNSHNVKFIAPATDTMAPPYVIPYDFDYAGLINAYYAVPSKELPIERVTERYYMGYGRNMEELEAALQPFKEQKDAINVFINSFGYISRKDRDAILKSIHEFYDAIESKSRVKYLFIDNALRG